MGCVLSHEWGWPRRRDGRDVQVCVACGSEREARVQFSKSAAKTDGCAVVALARPASPPVVAARTLPWLMINRLSAWRKLSHERT